MTDRIQSRDVESAIYELLNSHQIFHMRYPEDRESLAKKLEVMLRGYTGIEPGKCSCGDDAPGASVNHKTWCSSNG